MKTRVIVFIIIACIFSEGCSSISLNLKEGSKEQVEAQINYLELDEDEGAIVTISLKDGSQISGEILTIGDSALTIAEINSEWGVQPDSDIYKVANDNIQEIKIDGSSYVAAGIIGGSLLGGLIGGLAGAATMKDSDDDMEIYAAVIIGGGIGVLAGGIAGGIIGSNNSTDEIIIFEIPPGYDFSALKLLARYPDKNPNNSNKKIE